MKRLLDESTDELTRSLLSAGVEHRPPPGNKAQVIVALGAGSALGLFSANAFAWLGTTAGKVTAAGVAVGVAGAVFIANPGWLQSSAQQSSAQQSSAQQSSAQKAASDASAHVARVSSAGAASSGVERSGLVPAAGQEPALEPTASPEPAAALEPGAHEALALNEANGPQVEEGGAAAHGGAERISERRKKAWARKKLLAKKRASEAASADGAEAGVASGAEALEANSALDTEVRMVDDMHGAARRKDNVALARYVEQYRESFPDGQLKKEVAEFEARLERSDAP